jgi:hypothetical protein
MKLRRPTANLMFNLTFALLNAINVPQAAVGLNSRDHAFLKPTFAA